VTVQLPIRAEARYSRESLLSETADIVTSLREDGITENTLLFIPSAATDDILVLLQALEAAGLRNSVLGTGNWDMERIRQLGHAAARRIICACEANLDTVSAMGRSFIDAFRMRSARPVSKEAFFGFDACSMMLSLLDSGAETAAAIRKKSSSKFEGLRCPVDFTDGNVNRALRVAEFRNGAQVRLFSFYGR
jgi:hypothetical protein